MINEEGFWQDQQNAQKIIKESQTVKEKVDSLEKTLQLVEDFEVLLEMAEEDPTTENEKEVASSFLELQSDINGFLLAMLLNGEYDDNNAIMTIHPGAGGTESQDWADMLLRMFIRYGERNKYKVELLYKLDGDVAGIKSASIMFSGKNAYGYLKAEIGVHRLVRISPFDSASRRHTSFASIDVIPEIEENTTIDIDPSDLRIDTYRASGAGGQHVNKTESAIRITHLPTGIVVACQNERSQHQNKELAMKILRSKLAELLAEEHKEKINDLKGDYGQIAWGNQIRSYVFHPYSLVKDHRTNYETGNVQAVMDGELSGFISSYLQMGLSAKEE